MKNVLKRSFSFLLGSAPMFWLTHGFLKLRYFPYVRCVNYHDTPIEDAAEFEQQLIWLKKHFVNCNSQDLDGLLNSGKWDKTKPGIIVTFDDGLLSNYEVALPLLEKHGFTGFFMIPAKFPSLSVNEQHAFATNEKIVYRQHSADRPIAMSWEQISDLLSRGHVVTSHTLNHTWLRSNLSLDELSSEIVESKRILEERTGRAITDFTWVGGNESAYSRSAFEMIVSAGYTRIFCTNSMVITRQSNPLFIERSNLNPDFSMNQIRLVLGGIYDLKYFRKRNRVIKRLTA